ncbi:MULTISPECIES: NAD(P)-binding protein [unclassified Streptomyces]|uniref:NAD(P)-binding protein n=1 Tax=unclassified Streptomyces TaxID=2593676 RepID=UPI0009A100EE
MAGVRVVIVGGGIGGSTAAVALRAERIHADVYEQAHPGRGRGGFYARAQQPAGT